MSTRIYISHGAGNPADPDNALDWFIVEPREDPVSQVASLVSARRTVYALDVTPRESRLVPAPRPRLYGLTAEEWLHLASDGENSEVAPCCGNLGELRDLLRSLAAFQSPDDAGWHLSIGRHILSVLEGDGDGHGLGNREQFPLLHRVLDGIRAQQADPDPFGLGKGKELATGEHQPAGRNQEVMTTRKDPR